MADGLELGDVYGATIERIKAQDGDKSKLGMAALMWISYAERPLRADELCHALAVRLSTTNFNTSNVPSMSALIGCCQGLITVDKEASTVRLIHFTLQEYLFAHPDIFSRPHSVIAEICLTYLNSQQVKALSTDPSPGIQNTPFLEYCSVHWGAHAKKDLSEGARSLGLELLEGHYNQISTRLLLSQVKRLNFFVKQLATLSPFSGLHCASFFGIVEIVAGLIEMGCYDINEGDFSGRTPLAWAAHNGHEEVVKILLGREEVSPDKPCLEGLTPLSYAAWNGHEGVVEMLLRREEVNPNKPGNYGMTPLSYAAWNRHEGVVKMLLGREGVDPNKPNNDGGTPLSYAALGGHEGVVKILLGRKEVNPDKPDNNGRTPLTDAVMSGHEGAVKILLGRKEVNPDKPDNHGLTPLAIAAVYGHEGVVKILLGREEVSPNKPNNYGQTPLSKAARYGREGVVKILLRRDEVSPDKPDNNGQTPLFLAASFGYEGVVKILLGQEGVIHDRPDNDGRTPLSLAAGSGHKEVVALLQSREVVIPCTD